MAGRSKTTHVLARVLALTLAIVFVVFLSQVASHSHAKGQNEATCQVCQAAHLGPGPQAGALAVQVPLLSTGYVQPFVLAFHDELFFHDSPSRAPPAA